MVPWLHTAVNQFVEIKSGIIQQQLCQQEAGVEKDLSVDGWKRQELFMGRLWQKISRHANPVSDFFLVFMYFWGSLSIVMASLLCGIYYLTCPSKFHWEHRAETKLRHRTLHNLVGPFQFAPCHSSNPYFLGYPPLPCLRFNPWPGHAKDFKIGNLTAFLPTCWAR